MGQVIEHEPNSDKMKAYMKFTKRELIVLLLQQEAQVIAVDITRDPPVVTEYIYYIEYRVPSRGGFSSDKHTVIKFTNSEDITIENIQKKITGSNYNTYTITKITKL